MRSLLGDSMNTTSIQKVESNRFSRADLENKLLMVDDDMDMSALPKTNYIKSIVTSECKMDMERKGCLLYTSIPLLPLQSCLGLRSAGQSQPQSQHFRSRS